MLIFPCPKCGSKLQMADNLGGKKVRCAACEEVVTAPNPAEAIQPDSAPVKSKALATAVKPGARKTAGRDDEDDRPRGKGTDGAATAAAAAGAGIGVAGILAVVGGLVAVLVCCGVGAVVVALVLPAVQRVRESAARTQTINNMKQVALAEHNYHDTFMTLAPPKILNPPQNQPVDLSWRVNILPFVEQGGLFTRFNKASPWDGPGNRSLLGPMPKVYEDVLLDSDKKGSTETRFQYFTGAGTLWPDPSTNRRTLMEITAGTSNTFLFAESSSPVPWSKGADMALQPNQPLPLPPDNFLAAFADGSVRPIDRRRASDQVLRQHIDPKHNGPFLPLD